MTDARTFRGFRFPAEIILCVPVHGFEAPICAYAAMSLWPICSART